jgi:hypothetical protein
MFLRASTLVVAVVCALAVVPAAAQPVARPEFRATRTASPPVIDGTLSDEVWQLPPVPTGEFLSYNPLYGDVVPQKTTVWLSYDSDYLYFAFKCDDPEPSAIKTSVTRRDNIWGDDWVGISLDALGTGQQSYHMLVNASGVQLDMLNSVAGGEDTAPDWIWDSAGKLTDTGFTAEMRLPLQSIRLKGGADTRMGILFWRRISRLGVSLSWPALSPGVWVFERHASVRFDNLEPRLTRDILPSATYGRSQLRESPALWGTADGRAEMGLSAKVGLTSTITLDATVNPDFSQVESDAFQVEVNQRFPVFFGEKRPFFMEGAGIFSLAGTGNDGSLRTAVHTRRIVDPILGAKVTGSVGRVTFGSLTAVDEAAGRAAPADSAEFGKNRLFNVARAQYSLGPSNYIGALFTDASFAGGYNRVVGGDFSWRLSGAQRLEGFALATQTRALRGAAPSRGVGGVFGYNYSTQKWTAVSTIEHYDKGFEMATAFINRVGITSGTAFLSRDFYPDKTRHPWLRKVSLVTFNQGGQDRLAGGPDLLTVVGGRFAFTRQGFLGVQQIFGFEHWQGQRFKRAGTSVFGVVQLFRWLGIDGGMFAGNGIFYDLENPFLGRTRHFNTAVTLQPNGRLSQQLGYQRVAFDRAETRARVYTLHILNGKTTYQFTRAFSLRALAQYDSSRHRVLTDFLSSYEPRPGTVVYAGYGALLEQREFVDGRWVSGAGGYLASQRGLFFKASDLYRF